MTLDDHIRAIVREELHALGAVVASYSSTSLPPGISSREHFAAECRRLCVGEKHGRVWTVDAREWREARTKKRPALRVVPNEDDRADAYLDAVTRPTRATVARKRGER